MAGPPRKAGTLLQPHVSNHSAVNCLAATSHTRTISIVVVLTLLLQEAERERWKQEHVVGKAQKMSIQDKLRELSLTKPDIWRAIKEKELRLRYVVACCCKPGVCLT